MLASGYDVSDVWMFELPTAVGGRHMTRHAALHAALLRESGAGCMGLIV